MHFFILKPAEESKFKQRFSEAFSEAVQELASHISTMFTSSTSGNGRPQQWNMAMKYQLTNEIRHERLTKAFHSLVKVFFQIQDRQEELRKTNETIFDPNLGRILQEEDDHLKTFRSKWKVHIREAKNLSFATKLNWGDTPIVLKSWLDCGQRWSSRLETFMTNRMLWNTEADTSLPAELKSINDLFIRAYFCQSVDKEVKLMKNVSIDIPFCLPIVGKIVRGEPATAETLFTVTKGVYICDKEGENNIVTISRVNSGTCLFTVSQIRLGCISLKSNVASSSKLQPLCSAQQVSIGHSVSQAPSSIYLKADTNIGDVVNKLDNAGFAVVSFNDCFADRVAQILPSGHLSSLSSESVKREWFQLDGQDKFEEWQTPTKEFVEVIVGPMQDACTELMKCIDAVVFGEYTREYMHQRLMLASPGAKNQRPVVDVVRQSRRGMSTATSKGSLSVIGKSSQSCIATGWPATDNVLIYCLSKCFLSSTVTTPMAGNFHSPPPYSYHGDQDS